MKKSILAMSVLSALLFAGAVRAADSAPAPQKQTVCPIMGNAIDKSLFVDVDGKRVYLCCKGCIAAVQKDGAKIVKEMESKGIVLETVAAAQAAAAAAPAKGAAAPKAGGCGCGK